MPPVIKSIELKNILCHDHLTIKFENNITIITGPNGSGKSAIMAALGFVFGLKKNVHQRAKVNSDLLKSGKETGFVKVILLNNTFKRDFFTDEIIIKRNLDRNSTKLCIINQQKRIWSDKLKDLSKIVDHFKLHFDNPINYLTQDMSKIFLSASDEKELYDLYLKGTEIKDMRKLHEDTKVKADEMKIRINNTNKELMIVQKDIKHIKGKVEVLNNAVELENQLVSLENERNWSIIDFKGAEKLLKDVEILQAKFAEAVAKENEYEGDLKKIRDELNMENTKNEKIQSENLKIKISVQKELDNLVLQRREIENDITEIEIRIKKIQQFIDSTQSESPTDFKIEIEALNDQIENEKKIKTEKEVELEQIYEKNKKIDAKTSLLNQQITATKRLLNDAMKIKTSQIAFFGSEFDAFLNEVKRTKFKQSIIGPLASEITLVDLKWYKPISVILRNVLSSFAVYNQNDRSMMQQLVKKHIVKGVSILMPNMKNNKINYEKNKDHLTAIDVIKCPESIMNLLIMITQIERIILMEKREDAHKIIRMKPKNVDCAYIINGDVIKMFGNSITDFASRGDKFYFESSDARIDELNSRILTLSQSVSNLNRISVVDVRHQILSCEKSLNKLELELKEKEMKYNLIIQTQQFKEEDIDEEQLKVNVEQRNELMNSIFSIDEEIKNLKKKLELPSKTNSNVEKLKNKIDILEGELSYCKIEIKRNSDVINEKKNELKNKQVIIETECKKLLNLSLRPSKIRDLQIIEDEILTLKSRIEVSKRGLNRDELVSRLKELEFEEKQKITLTKNYERRLEAIYNAYEKRIIKREELNIKESKRAALTFVKLTKERNYIGELIFNHKEEKLAIVMKDGKSTIEQNFNKLRVGDKNTLSGGERTFAGICLLMSLWPSISCPIKILDEFDVYMDNLNRKAAIESLIFYFKKNGCQGILISPLGTLEIPDINIVVLQPPRSKN